MDINKILFNNDYWELQSGYYAVPEDAQGSWARKTYLVAWANWVVELL